MPFNLTPEPVDTGYDLTAAKPPVAPLEKEKLEDASLSTIWLSGMHLRD